MQEQNYSNHKRFHPIYHYVILPLAIAGLVGSVINLTKASSENLYSASLLLVAFILLFLIGAFVRLYSLKVQNRLIRSEENFRHYTLTGKTLSHNLRMGQIIALRFASDEEFPSLASRAVNEKMKPDEIKKSIRNWRADHYRV
jgi:hypothetical protein